MTKKEKRGKRKERDEEDSVELRSTTRTRARKGSASSTSQEINEEFEEIKDGGGVGFQEVGGLDSQIQTLRRMLLLPLLSPDLMGSFNIGRGVLLCGPPGTGKTLVARAIAVEASHLHPPVHFYVWVGRTERGLSELFEMARRNQPSIIFFDEIDGLVRGSFVSTLSALIDRAQVGRNRIMVIGAANRADHVDPALHHPSRFHRQLHFPLPNTAARAQILEIHTRKWPNPPSMQLRAEIASLSTGHSGADLAALCTEAALLAFQRQYPNFGDLQCPDSLTVEQQDFYNALATIPPPLAHVEKLPLPAAVGPCLLRRLNTISNILSSIFPTTRAYDYQLLPLHRPKILLCGKKGTGLDYLAAAMLYKLEAFPVYNIGMPTIMSELSSKTAEEKLIHTIREAQQNAPSILFLPYLELWWEISNNCLRGLLHACLREFSSNIPVLLLGTAEITRNELNSFALSIFENYIYEIGRPLKGDRIKFVSNLVEASFSLCYFEDQHVKKSVSTLEGTQMLSDKRNSEVLLRRHLKEVCNRLSSIHLYGIHPIKITKKNGGREKEILDVAEILQRVDNGLYTTLFAFLQDLQLLINAKDSEITCNKGDKVAFKEFCTDLMYDIVSGIDKDLLYSSYPPVVLLKSTTLGNNLKDLRTSTQDSCATWFKSSLTMEGDKLLRQKVPSITITDLFLEENVGKISMIKRKLVRYTKGYNIEELKELYSLVLTSVLTENKAGRTYMHVLQSLKKLVKDLESRKRHSKQND